MTTIAPGREADVVTVPAQRLPPPERRGRTEIAGRAVTKIACCAAEEVPEVRAVHLRGLPWTHPSSAEVHGDLAVIRMDVSVAYPSPLHAVAVRLREHVIRRVTYQTGLTVTRLDITMTDLGGDPR
ncbi:Asp23/Gls24 family envelope stress response protein [Nonomuraea basaltis]|uniref:Asp23/Gls24 family envelope stress response protein n=1 Tax=Nonomuraea basaltis TaxID=2495887 RepID=UPI00110C6BDD|nr:Asp23/Gls24 family envelope stress response protein [Nonomuraea basaltis]TMS00748.1 Asp23/Gls24 family envelope stress response protein [Nonomuraea basaltis]